TLQDNTAPATGTAAAGRGGAIYNDGGSVTVGNSTLTANTAVSVDATLRGLGGAIFTRNGAVAFTSSTAAANAAGDGGVLYALGDGATATVTFADSQLGGSDASADLQGGVSNGGGVVFRRSNSGIDRIAGPWIGALGAFVLGATDQLTFYTNDAAPDLALSATSANHGIVPNSGLTITSTSTGHTLNVVAAHAGVASIDLIAASDGVEFHETFTAYATSGEVSQPTAYPQATPAIYPFQSVVIDPILGKVYDIDGNPYSGGNGPASDPNGLALFVSEVGAPAHGTATINDDGRIVYTHTDADYTSGSDEFTYTISNGFGGTATSGVHIDITPPGSTITDISQLPAAIAQAAANPTLTWTIRIAAGGSNQTWSTTTILSAGALYSAFRISAGHVVIDASDSPGFALAIGAFGPPPRFFVVDAGATLELKSLRLAGGTAYDAFALPQGGAVLNLGTFTADHVTFQNNSTYSGYGNGSGGALYNDGGTAALTDCVFANNHANNTGYGGAITSRNGTLTLTRVTFSGNTATVANDLYVLGDGATATLNLSSTTPTGYVFATANGGALAVSGLLAGIADTLHRDANAAVTVAVADLLANDIGDSPAFVSADATSANGVAISVAGGVLTYAASPLTADDSFTYTVQDSHGATATATVHVLFNNHAPVARDDEVTVGADGTLTIDVATLLANDTDADGDTLTIIDVGYPEQDSDAWIDGNTVIYEAYTTLTTDDTFTYTITDSHGATATATVTVHPYVAPVPTLTIAPRTGGGVTLELTAAANTSYTIEVSTNLTSWSELTTVTTDADGVADLEDTTSPAEGAGRFYRAVSN
ncbi:MAG TPA: Ig-like domain-containing protein, partial [Opitutus sp.]|nr:Ig-like domain-containing protein [Opitutus sp.]